ncbi:MAG TPA: hypothetical protein VLA52_05215, partial [Thermohalobaculum sp.]|nr:hypothetical protein [Thermohalobaculum sp.]
PPARPARSRHKAHLVGSATPLMGAINSPMNRLRNSLTEIALSVLAYNLTPVKTSSASALIDNKSH